MTKKQLLLLITTFVLLTLTACSSTQPTTPQTENSPLTVLNNQTQSTPTTLPAEEFEMENPDQSFLTGQPCEAPCFHNIQLLSTTGEEAKQILLTLPFINPVSIVEEENYYEDDSYYLNYACGENPSELCGYVGVSPYDLVTGIGNKIFYPLTLAEVVDKYGKPDFTYRNASYRGENVCELVIYFVDQSIAVEILEDGERGVCQNFTETKKLPGELQIDWVYYNFIDQEIATNMIKWQGLQ